MGQFLVFVRMRMRIINAFVIRMRVDRFAKVVFTLTLGLFIILIPIYYYFVLVLLRGYSFLLFPPTLALDWSLVFDKLSLHFTFIYFLGRLFFPSSFFFSHWYNFQYWGRLLCSPPSLPLSLLIILCGLSEVTVPIVFEV